MKITTNKKFNQPNPVKSHIKSPTIRNHKEMESSNESSDSDSNEYRFDENHSKICENDNIFINEMQMEKNKQNQTKEKEEMKISDFTGSEIKINNNDKHNVSFECKNKSSFLKESEILPQAQILENLS